MIYIRESEWKKRTAFPVGMNDKGGFFYQPYTGVSSDYTTIEPERLSQNNTKPWWKFW